MANQVVRRVLVASLIFLLMQPEVLPGFLGPQHDQGRRSKPRAGALTNDVPDVADAPGEPKQEKTETKVQEMLWTALVDQRFRCFHMCEAGAQSFVSVSFLKLTPADPRVVEVGSY
mmetsp:Transcript_100942/g.140265  ORF Transcript_100942/g.140265 Transcript_100942/m.140265 type:complete len:116 (-) Transcript_100942:123-470(-)